MKKNIGVGFLVCCFFPLAANAQYYGGGLDTYGLWEPQSCEISGGSYDDDDECSIAGETLDVFTVSEPAPSQTLLPPDTLDFRPASALRRQILKEYFPTAEAKAELKAAIGGTDLIAAMDGLLPQFGLRTDNVADAMTVWAVGAYSLIHDDDRQLDKATVQAVRGPLALGLMSAPQLGEMSDADKQQFAERLLIISYAYDSVRQLKTKDPAGHAQMVQVARDHAAVFGFDVDGVTLVKGEGFKPKGSTAKAAAPSISAASGSSGAAWLAAQSPVARKGIEEEAAELGMRAEDMVDGNGDLTPEAKQKMRELGWE